MADLLTQPIPSVGYPTTTGGCWLRWLTDTACSISRLLSYHHWRLFRWLQLRLTQPISSAADSGPRGGGEIPDPSTQWMPWCSIYAKCLKIAFAEPLTPRTSYSGFLCSSNFTTSFILVERRPNCKPPQHSSLRIAPKHKYCRSRPRVVTFAYYEWPVHSSQ